MTRLVESLFADVSFWKLLVGPLTNHTYFIFVGSVFVFVQSCALHVTKT